MTDFAKELEHILRNDPLGLLKEKSKQSSVMTADERLLQSFEEINVFYREHGRAPQKTRDITERKLYSRLQGLLENPSKAEALTSVDEFGLLVDAAEVEPTPIETLDDIFNDDAFDRLEEQAEDIFTLRHVSAKPSRPEYTARRKPCKEFDRFEPLFQRVHNELATGRRVSMPFTGETQIEPDTIFLLGGSLVYVAGRGEFQRKNFAGRRLRSDARLYCVFENGTESNMFQRSLAAALWKKENSRIIVEAEQLELADEFSQLGQPNEPTGYVYVVRSLSEDLSITNVPNLYKIGFTTKGLKARLTKAATDPTFLMADVKPVDEFEVYDCDAQKVEALLHRFFGSVQVELEVEDSKGEKHMPREWFSVPRDQIATAVRMMVAGDIINYFYDPETQEIQAKERVSDGEG